jgi:hypothetical protein
VKINSYSKLKVRDAAIEDFVKNLKVIICGGGGVSRFFNEPKS